MMYFSRLKNTNDYAFCYFKWEVDWMSPRYKYLGIFSEENLCFIHHIECSQKCSRLSWDSITETNAVFLLVWGKNLFKQPFLGVIDYGDILCMHANLSSLKILESEYHAALRFVSDSSFCTHHCSLYMRKLVGLLCTIVEWNVHIFLLIRLYCLICLPNLCSLLSPKTQIRCYNLWS